MTLKELTEFMSEVGKEHADLVQDRNVSLFIDKVIERAKLRWRRPDPAPPVSPCDIDDH